jgi:hypothetical protein
MNNRCWKPAIAPSISARCRFGGGVWGFGIVARIQHSLLVCCNTVQVLRYSSRLVVLSKNQLTTPQGERVFVLSGSWSWWVRWRYLWDPSVVLRVQYDSQQILELCVSISTKLLSDGECGDDLLLMIWNGLTSDRSKVFWDVWPWGVQWCKRVAWRGVEAVLRLCLLLVAVVMGRCNNCNYANCCYDEGCYVDGCYDDLMVTR